MKLFTESLHIISVHLNTLYQIFEKKVACVSLICHVENDTYAGIMINLMKMSRAVAT